jgi:glycosyltransferase involved in cell wall biosynthesis
MALGKPIVASRVNVLPEMIQHEESGFLFEPGNSEELANFLLKLCENPELRKTMGKRAFENVQRFHDVKVFGLMTERFFYHVREFQLGTKCRL